MIVHTYSNTHIIRGGTGPDDMYAFPVSTITITTNLNNTFVILENTDLLLTGLEVQNGVSGPSQGNNGATLLLEKVLSLPFQLPEAAFHHLQKLNHSDLTLLPPFSTFKALRDYFGPI